MLDDMLGEARARRDRLAERAASTGLKYVIPPDSPFSVGFGVAWSASQFSLLTIMGGGNGTEGIVNITGGVLRDLRPDRTALLEKCNSKNQDNAWVPCFLHEAEAGWDVLVQQRHLYDALVSADPMFLRTYLEVVAQATEAIRDDFRADSGIAGVPYEWNDTDLGRLMIRSVV